MVASESHLRFTDKVEAERWIDQTKQQWVVRTSAVEIIDGWWVATVGYAIKNGALVPVGETDD